MDLSVNKFVLIYDTEIIYIVVLILCICQRNNKLLEHCNKQVKLILVVSSFSNALSFGVMTGVKEGNCRE